MSSPRFYLPLVSIHLLKVLIRHPSLTRKLKSPKSDDVTEQIPMNISILFYIEVNYSSPDLYCYLLTVMDGEDKQVNKKRRRVVASAAAVREVSGLILGRHSNWSDSIT